ncbi:MAG TPA: terminase TerL endonuclease subunit [Planctomycetota bacterium]|nr:terminase TerL endonuclease subunit [Planctomycetota bacterium]
MSRHPVAEYMHGVLDGSIVAGRLVRLAVERQQRDMDEGMARGLRFDRQKAEHALQFFNFLKHSKGEWAGQWFLLEPWQQFIVWCTFGWIRADGYRRYRVAYEEVARKNGKSTTLAGTGLYLLTADGEPGAEVYSAATKRDQAKIAWSEAVRMRDKSPALTRMIQHWKSSDTLTIQATASKYQPLGADGDTMDGLNVHGALIDEVHAHRTREVVDVLETATGARRQPLTVYITTAGYDRKSVCWELHEYSRQVLERTIQDDTWFAYIATIDEKDEWTDPAVWPKANPNLGVSVKLDDLERKCAKAQHLPAAQNAFKRLHLNVWTQQSDRWIDMVLWEANAGPRKHVEIEAACKGRLCYGGLDLSSVSDITAWVMVFPQEEDPDALDILCRFWCPEARLTDKTNRYAEQYKAWAQAGYLNVTSGDAVDYAFVRQAILEDAQRFAVVNLNVDRLFQGYQLSQELADEGLEVFGMGQGFLGMAAPMREFERRLLAKKLHHGGHPLLAWMADNVSVKQDPAGNLKPDKAASEGKIDGIVGLVMAVDRAMRHEKPKRSVYEDRGVVFG